jgi:hypothetical protein
VRAGPAVHLRLAPPAGAARALPGFAGAVELRWTP